jgi:hypothetical protein
MLCQAVIKAESEGDFMTKQGFAIAFLSCFVLSTGLQAQFARIYGGQYSDVPVEMLPAEDGGFIVFGDSLSFPGRAWLMKLAADGSVLWEKAYAVEPSGALRAACTTPEGGYLIGGGTYSKTWLIKTDSQGETEWQRSLVDNTAVLYALYPSADSGHFLIGSAAAGGSNTDIWAMKISPDGDPVWEKAYGLSDTESGLCAAPTADGGCVIAGVASSSSQSRMIVLKIDPLGALSWQKAYAVADYTEFQAAAIQAIDGGGFILAGSLSSNLRADGFVITLGESGALLGARSYAGGIRDIQATEDGGWVVAGRIGPAHSPTEILAMKLAADGGIDWQRAFGGPFEENGASAIETADGGCALAGSTASYGAGAEDICVIRLTPAGELGTCRFSKNPSLVAATLNVTETDIGLLAREMSSIVQTGSFGLSDTAGISRSYELCATRKLLTLRAGLSISPSLFTPELGSHVYDTGASVTITAPQTVGGSGGHYQFQRWDVDVTGSAPTLTFTITDDTVARAQYTWKDEGGDDGDDDDPYHIGRFCAMDKLASGTPLASAVALFREFRDQRLLPYPLGRAFVASYYRWSPTAVRAFRAFPPLKLALRVLLVPLVAVSFLVVKLGWIPSLLLMAAAAALSFRRVRSGLRRRSS